MKNFPSGDISGWRIFRVEKKMLENIPVGEFTLENLPGFVFSTTVWFGSGMRPNPHGKSHHFLDKCTGKSMTRPCAKSMSCSSTEN